MSAEALARPSRWLVGVPAPLIRFGRRLAGAFVVILGVVTLTFLFTRVFAGDPVSLFASQDATQAQRDAIRERLGLSDPLPVQYGHYLGNLLRGDLGVSYTTNRPVTADLFDRLPATAELAVYALILGTLAGVVAGVLSAVLEGSWFDRIIRVVTAAGLSLPQYWVALMLLWLFFVTWGVLPGPAGRLPIGMDPPPTVTGFYLVDSLITGDVGVFGPALAQLVLPVLTLGYAVFSPLARGARSAMVHALKADYIRTSRALGISRPRIWFSHALKNALLPVVTMLAGTVGYVFAGSVLVESAFGWPGIGQYALTALRQSDFPAVQGFVLYVAIFYVILYQLLDLLYIAIDPRIHA